MPRTYTGKSKNQFGFAKPSSQRKAQVKGKTEHKYKYKKSVKGKDRVLNTDYLDNRYLKKDKMELKLSTFKDTTVNDTNFVDTNIVGDTVIMDSEFMNPANIESIYAYTSGGYASADAGYLLIQYGQNLTSSYVDPSLPACFPAGSFSWQTEDTMASNFSAGVTNGWGSDNEALVAKDAANIVQGDYVTLKRSIYNLEITMDTLSFDRDLTDSLLVAPGVNGVKPIEFRVLHLLPNRKITVEASDDLNCLKRLWLLPNGKQGGLVKNTDNTTRGMNNPSFFTQEGLSPAEMFDMPIDRSYYHTISDQKFILQNPASSLSGYKGEPDATDTTSYLINQSVINNKFPGSRKLSFVVNYESDDSNRKRGDNKIQLETTSTGYVGEETPVLNYNYFFKQPKDMNFRDVILILCKSSGTNEAADSGNCQKWHAAGYGSLSAYDN